MVLPAPAGDAFVQVGGQWTTPVCALPFDADAAVTYVASVWTGIDGEDGTQDVLQAGCDTYVSLSGGGAVTTSCRAWCEWYDGPSYWLDGLKVSLGDVLSCDVHLDPYDTRSASIQLSNLTTNDHANYGLQSPGVGLAGNCAEWIVEAYGNLGPLARFHTVDFSNCQARTQSGVNVTSGAGRPVAMKDATTNLTVALCRAIGSSGVQVQYV